MTSRPTLFELDQAFKSTGIKDEPIEAYHAGPGISFSGLKEYAKTPAHYLQSKLRGDSEETSSQRLGTLAHMAILEPVAFKSRVVAIEGHRGANKTKEAVAAAESEGKYVCKPEEYETALRLALCVQSNPLAVKLLSGGQAERSIYWRDPETKVLLKCRPDYLRPDGVIVDLKTYEDLSEESIQKQIFRMRYHWQSAFYLRGVNQLLGTQSKMFAHVFLDTKALISRVVVLDDASLDAAENKILPMLAQYAEHLNNNSWPGYPDEILTVTLPSYAW